MKSITTLLEMSLTSSTVLEMGETSVGEVFLLIWIFCVFIDEIVQRLGH